MIWLIGVALIVLGAAALIVGLRRSRRGSDPHCARCHHNLSGLPDATRCPECGAELTHERARRIGAPYRRARWAVAGALTAALGIAMLSAMTNPNILMAWLPDWAVAMQVKSAGGYEGAARTEIVKRLGAGTLGRGTVDGLVEHALARQADRTTAWDPFWGDVVESAHAQGLVTPEAWNAYLAEGMRMPVLVRKRVRPGDRLPIRVTHEVRFGSLTGDARFSLIAPVSEDWNPDFTRWRSWMGTTVSASSGGTIGTSIQHEFSELGRHDVRIGIKIGLYDPATSKAIWEGSHIIAVPMEVVEDDNLCTVDASNSAEDVRAVLTIRDIRITGSRGPEKEANFHGMIDLVRDAAPTEWPLAFSIIARVDGVKYNVGTMAAPRGLTNHGWGLWQSIQNLPDSFDRLDLVLRCAPIPTSRAVRWTWSNTGTAKSCSRTSSFGMNAPRSDRRCSSTSSQS